MDIHTQLKPIKKKSIVDQIVDRIISAVTTGQYKAGSRLPSEFELMEELNVSRNSLREALKILESMGIIEIKRGDGTYVCSQLNPSAFDAMIYGMIFDTSSCDELVELRQALDEIMMKFAISKSNDEEVNLLQENINQYKTCQLSGKLKEAAKLDWEFHAMLIKLSKNSFLIRIATGIYKLYVDSIANTIIVGEEYSQTEKFHQQMVDCIKNKDYVSVHSVVEESLTAWKHCLDDSNK